MGLYLILEIGELTFHRIECVADTDIDIFVLALFMPFAIDDQFFPRHDKVDANIEELALMVMLVGFLDDDTTIGNLVVIAAELFRTFPNSGFDRIGMVKILEGHAHGYDLIFHTFLPFRSE